MPTQYFLGTRLFAQSPRNSHWRDEIHVPTSQILFCPTCGEICGRIQVPNTQWMCATRGCVKHPDWRDMPGGLFIPSWRHGDAAMDELPREVLAREIDLWINHYESTL